jgi:hypothetical protein
MRSFPRLLLVLALGTIPSGEALAKSVRTPVVVELFTAQGCASCKQANSLVAKLAERPGVIALTWAVDYWDYLGWRDTFAMPDFADRQKAYALRLGPTDVYTPQVVVDGASQVSGDDAAGVEAMIKGAQLPQKGRPKILYLKDGGVRLSADYVSGGRADVWLIRFNPREQDVEVKAGENRGATVVHRNVVRQIVRLGAWTGHAAHFTLPPPSEDGLASAVIVQRPRGGAILAAAEYRPR